MSGPLTDSSQTFGPRAKFQKTLWQQVLVLTTLAQARERLRQQFLKTGTPEQFEAILPFLTGDKDERIAALAAKLGKNEGATRTFLSRLRAEHRQLILDVIADTLANKEEAETEFAYFKEVLRRTKYTLPEPQNRASGTVWRTAGSTSK